MISQPNPLFVNDPAVISLWDMGVIFGQEVDGTWFGTLCSSAGSGQSDITVYGASSAADLLTQIQAA